MDIVHGKDSTTNIVNISFKDNNIHIFTETNGIVSHAEQSYKQWVLSPKSFAKDWLPLKGNQHYKYIKEYDYSEFQSIKKNIYKNKLYTIYNASEAFMTKNGHTYFKNMRLNEVSLLSFDIETTGLSPYAEDAAVLLITNTYRGPKGKEQKVFCLDDYATQVDMIYDWCNWLQEKDPSLIIGHNIVIFDIPYIATLMRGFGLGLPLGRFGEDIEIEERTREFRKDGSQSYSYNRINVFGREVIDTFFLSIKADISRKYDSYGLKNIIKQEGLEKEGRQHYDAATIKANWNNPEEKAKIIQYGMDDSEDPIKLFDLMVASFFYLTPHIPKTFQSMIESATGSQINSLMVRSYLQDGYSVAIADYIEPFEGAVSFGNVGIYDNVFKVDVASLYPNIMRYYKIYPKTKDFNGNFLNMLEYFTEERLKNKKLAKETGDRYYKDLEQAQKVVINSAYGFMGASGLNYNYGEGAAEVTEYGREIITHAVAWAESKEYKVSNCDTDSISFTTGKDLTKADREALLKEINDMYPDAIKFEDDGYYPRVVIVKAKNYILWDGKKIKLKGSSLRDQKKEPALKAMLSEMIDCLVFNHPKDVINIYHKYIKMAMNVSDIKQWCQKKTITKPVLECRGYTQQDIENKTLRKNETVIWDAVKNVSVQEGDKVYLYPAVLDSHIERKEYKNGNVKEKIVKTTGLKLAEYWNKDHDVDKFIERVYSTTEILAPVINIDELTDYTLIKNKPLLEAI